MLLSLSTPSSSFKDEKETSQKSHPQHSDDNSDNNSDSNDDEVEDEYSSMLTLMPVLMDNFSNSTIRYIIFHKLFLRAFSSFFVVTENRLTGSRRRQWCNFFLSLFEGDHITASKLLKELGFHHIAAENDTTIAQKDAEFFEHLFRDAAVSYFDIRFSFLFFFITSFNI